MLSLLWPCYDMGSIPGPGTSACCVRVQKPLQNMVYVSEVHPYNKKAGICPIIKMKRVLETQGKTVSGVPLDAYIPRWGPSLIHFPSLRIQVVDPKSPSLTTFALLPSWRLRALLFTPVVLKLIVRSRITQRVCENQTSGLRSSQTGEIWGGAGDGAFLVPRRCCCHCAQDHTLRNALGSSHHGTEETNLTRNHEIAGSIPWPRSAG